MNVGVQKAVSAGAVVHYYLASVNLADKELKLLSRLKDIHFYLIDWNHRALSNVMFIR